MDSSDISRQRFWDIYEKCKIWGPHNFDNVSRNIFSGLLDFDIDTFLKNVTL